MQKNVAFALNFRAGKGRKRSVLRNMRGPTIAREKLCRFSNLMKLHESFFYYRSWTRRPPFDKIHSVYVHSARTIERKNVRLRPLRPHCGGVVCWNENNCRRRSSVTRSRELTQTVSYFMRSLWDSISFISRRYHNGKREI